MKSLTPNKLTTGRRAQDSAFAGADGQVHQVDPIGLQRARKEADYGPHPDKQPAACRNCRFWVASAVNSGQASSRGFCRRFDFLARASYWCEAWAARGRTTGASAPGCGLPAIQSDHAGACFPPRFRDPEAIRQTVELRKRVFITITAPLQVIDFGNGMLAGFTTGPYGRVINPATPGVFALTTSPSTLAWIRDITIAWDPFARIPFSAVEIEQTLRSYGHTWSALLAGQITIESEPYPTVIPIASAMKSTGGIDAYWTIEPGGSDQALYYVSAEKESTHKQAPAPLAIRIDPAERYNVLAFVPSRATNFVGGAPTAWPGFAFVWTGVLTVLQENNTLLTSFAMPDAAAVQ